MIDSKKINNYLVIEFKNTHHLRMKEFISEIEKIISALNVAIGFALKWKPRKVNPDIDNT